MHLRSFRAILLFTCLICLVVLSGAVAVVRATPSTTHAGRSFPPDGHGVANPTKVDTATTPQVLAANSGGMVIQPSAPARGATVPAPQGVVSVPPPTSTDPTANEGQFKSGGGKPDANGAGGLYNYLETVNTGFAIYNRGGAQRYTTTFQTWFGINSIFYDPVTMWDNTGNRFMFSVLQASYHNLLLSVAQQANALGHFCNYTFPTLPGRDFDKLGVDSDGIYFSVNLLASGTHNVVSNELFYANRTALESCQSASYSTWSGLTNPDGTIAQAITPARQDTSAAGVEYLVNSYPSGACQLTLWTLTSSGTLTNTSVATQCYSPSPKAQQKGSAALIDTGDCSITQANYVNGLLTLDTLGSYDWGDGNGPVGIVEWFVLNAASASVASQGAFGTPGYWLFYPSTIMTANGKMLFVYNASGSSIYPSVWYTNQAHTSSTALANGVSYFGKTGISPWGDYQSAWPDASVRSANAVWITGEYVKATNSWGTRFDLITP